MKLLQRKIQTFGETRMGNCRLKTYKIWPAENQRMDPMTVGAMNAQIAAFVEVEESEGIGYVIVHEGETDCYLVIAKFGKEGEILMKSWTRPKGAPTDAMREVAPHEPIMCIWEMQAHTHAVQTFLEHILMTPRPNMQAYMDESLLITL